MPCRFRRAQVPPGTPATFCSCIICDRHLKGLLAAMGPTSRPPGLGLGTAAAAAAARGANASVGRGRSAGSTLSSQCRCLESWTVSAQTMNTSDCLTLCFNAVLIMHNNVEHNMPHLLKQVLHVLACLSRVLDCVYTKCKAHGQLF